MKTYTKRDLTNLTAKSCGVSQKVASDVVTAFLEHVRVMVLAGNRVELRSFGAFGTKVRKPRVARNPGTGETINIPQRMGVTFKPGELMKPWEITNA